jgi:uncharacterized protein (TIGR02145 family)
MDNGKRRSWNEIYRQKIGNSIFFPAAGCRYYNDGTLGSAGEYGGYWSSTEYDSSDAYYLGFDSSDAGVNGDYCTYGQSVRCVAE